MDITTETALSAWIADSNRAPVTISALDLRPFRMLLARAHLAGCVLLGCDLDGGLDAQASAQGATVIPTLPGIPFSPFRNTPYRVPDLYRGFKPGEKDSRKRTFDYANYLWFMNEKTQLPKALGTAEQMYGRLHDTALEAALARFIYELKRPVVGFMGGHDIDRDKPIFRTVAALARTLARKNFLVVSGGGPGLMEAANLGAFLVPYPDSELDSALATLAKAPKFAMTDEWLNAACEVRARLLEGEWDSEEDPASVNIGIPTWLYGHEPPNMFATHAAKLFYNSLREDGLVTIAGAGLIFGRGNAGTVQEIFQDATQNYYRPAGVSPTPMALLEAAFWTRPAAQGPDPGDRKKPLEPLLTALAKEKPATDWSAAILITDDSDEIVKLIAGNAMKAGPAAAPTRADLWLEKRVQA